jgi:hypothetical protein
VVLIFTVLDSTKFAEEAYYSGDNFSPRNRSLCVAAECARYHSLKGLEWAKVLALAEAVEWLCATDL